jgi:spermidine/putrescine-binding protein
VRRVFPILVLVSAIAAAACSDGGSTTTATTQPHPSRQVACRPNRADGSLVLANWKKYLDPKLVRRFSKKFGVEVRRDTYPSNEELQSRLTAKGGSGYDLIVPSDYMVGRLRASGLLLPLDQRALPNRTNLAKAFRSLPFDPDDRFSVPYQWGTTGIAVRRGALEGRYPHSWSLLFNAAVARRTGARISALDDARETLGAALIYLGKSVNTTDTATLERAALVVRSSRIATFTSNGFAAQLERGSVNVAHGWNGDFLVALGDKIKPTLAGSEFEYFVPDEGGIAWVDSMAIPIDAKHPCTAHAFINFILDARNGAALSNYNSYASPNSAARAFIAPEILNDPAIYPPRPAADRLQFLADVGPVAAQYQERFDAAKAARTVRD